MYGVIQAKMLEGAATLPMKPPTDQHLVTSTWALVSGDLAGVGKLFYATLFEQAPELSTTLFAKVNMETQALRLMQVVDAAVGLLGKPDELVPALMELGKRHVGYGVEEKHYGTVAVALLATLKKGLGSAFTPEVEATCTA